MASSESLPKPAPALVDANSSKEYVNNCTGYSVTEIRHMIGLDIDQNVVEMGPYFDV